MELNERYYQKTVSAIGWALLIFWGLMQGFGVAIAVLSMILSELPVSPVVSDVVYQLLYGTGYMLTFMLPVLFLSLILKKKGCEPRHISFEPHISPYLPFLVFASIAVCFSAAQLNAYLVSFFNYSEFTSELLQEQMGTGEPYEIILNFIVVAVVPGICEEFFFRGAILSNLLPFGRTNAILISSFFFSMMHQNVGQFFYTFAVGIILGLVYERTGSIWNCTLIHILNHFVSVLEESIPRIFPESTVSAAFILCIDATIYLLGAISVFVLVSRFFSKRSLLSDGAFGKEIPPSDVYAHYPLPAGRAARLFCTAPVIIFICLCCVQAGLLILLATLGGFW